MRKGEHWAIFGANGAGKTSFLKLLYGDLVAGVGRTHRAHGFSAGTPIAEWKRQVGYVSPELQTDYAVDVTVLDLVASGRYASIGLAEAPTADDRRAALRWLKFFRLLSVARRRRVNCPTGSCDARSLRGRWPAGRASCCSMNR